MRGLAPQKCVAIMRYALCFKLRAYGRKTISYQIRLRVTFGGQRVDELSGWNLVSPDDWNESDQSVRPEYIAQDGTPAATINKGLVKMRDVMEAVLRYFDAIEVMPSAKDVHYRFKEKMGQKVMVKPDLGAKKEKAVVSVKPKTGFFDAFDEFCQECGEKNAWTKATIQKMDALKEDLKDFQKKITLADLTESTLTAFIGYLRDTKKLRRPRKKLGERKMYDDDDVTGLRNTTIDKKLGYLRWFLNWAEKKGYKPNPAYKTFRPTLKRTQKKVLYLSREELNRIRTVELTGGNAYLEPVRDVFLFCCFSSLRHSDVSNLRRDDVKEDHIEVTTVKTADSISIELNDMTRAILEKYKDIPFKDGKALPTYTNQAMNRDIKELCRLAGIDEGIRVTTYKGSVRNDEIHPKWELLGTHTGRRTFIVNALSLGIAPNIVMKWTGHSDYKSMKPYIDIVDSIKASSMTMFNGLL